MRKSVIAALLVVAMIMGIHYASAGNSYDEFKATVKKSEETIAKYEKENEVLQEYLDAAESGDQAKWETARNKADVRNAILMHKDKEEIDAVRSQMETNNILINMAKADMIVAQHKMDIYYHAYILKDLDAVKEILGNGNRTIPENLSENFYCAWPYTELPDGFFTVEDVFNDNRGNVFLMPATILEAFENKEFMLDLNGVKVRALVYDDRAAVGETVNAFFTPLRVEKDSTPFIVVGAEESLIDIFHQMRMKDGE